MSELGLGAIHIHIDGPVPRDVLEQILDEFAAEGVVCKYDDVIDATVGEHRRSFPDVYAVHTPGEGTEERFERFSTLQMRSRPHVVHTLERILRRLSTTRGLVIEAERVLARLTAAGQWLVSESASSEIAAYEVGFAPADVWPIEIHFLIDVPVSFADPTEPPPLSLGEFHRHCEDEGIDVGGWFMFARDGEWAYRSNLFCDAMTLPDLRDLIDRQRLVLTALLNRMGRSYRIRAVVEDVLGVWKTPLRTSRPQ